MAETDFDLTTAESRVPNAHFLHFSFTASQIAAFPVGSDIFVRIDHHN